MDSNDIDIFSRLDYIKNKAGEFAQAKGEVEYAEQYRKTLKAELMSEMNGESIGAQERYAYSHDRYKAHLVEQREAIRKYEKLRIAIDVAKLGVQVWQTLSANERIEKKVI